MKEIVSGAIYGAITDPYSSAAEEHAELFYESIRNRIPSEVSVIASRTGFTKSQVLLIRNYLFIDEHELDDGYQRFDCSFEIAQSWQRLSDENLTIEPHDITLLRHELLEISLVREGLSQNEAHESASKKYDYAEESMMYYAEKFGNMSWLEKDVNSGAIRRLSHRTH